MPDWSQLVTLNTPVIEILFRGTVMFLAIFTMLRVLGKREGGVHSLTDLLVVVLVAQAAAHGMAGEGGGVLDSLILIATILGWSLALDFLAYEWKPLGRLLKPSPSALVIDGKANRRALRREFMSDDELMAELRLHGITDLKEVARAYLENNGMVSVIRRSGDEAEEPKKPPALG